MQLILPVCPIHFNGGAGHDTKFPICILMPLVTFVVKISNNGDSVGKKGRVEI